MSYLLNLRTGMLHRFPAFESCNLDAVPGQYRQRATDEKLLTVLPQYRRHCKRCFRRFPKS